VENLERLFAGFGMRLARSPDDDWLTAIVQDHRRKFSRPLPRNCRFVISKRSDGWAVSVADIDALLRGERAREGDAYHIEDKDGRLRLLNIEAGI
jgi:hypothetical protein